MDSGDLFRFIAVVVTIAWAIGAFRGVSRRMAAPERPAQQPPAEPVPEPARPPATLRLTALPEPAQPSATRPVQTVRPASPVPSAPPVRPTPAPSLRAPAPAPEVVVVEQLGGPLRPPRGSLQRAVVWAEILSPPLALRDAGTLGRPAAL